MVERRQLGQEWIMYGDDPGQKAAGLLLLQDMKPEGIQVLPGVCLGISLFQQFLDHNKWPLFVPEWTVSLGKRKQLVVELSLPFF